MMSDADLLAYDAKRNIGAELLAELVCSPARVRSHRTTSINRCHNMPSASVGVRNSGPPGK